MPDTVSLTLAFELDLQTDPLGATLSLTITDAVSAEVRDQYLDSVYSTLVGAEGNLVFQAVQQAHDQLRSYGSENDFRVESIIDSFQGVEADRSADRITASWSWSHEAAAFYEFGTSDHTVDGDPLLVFEFDAAEYPYLEEMFPGGTAFLQSVDVSGLPEARWVRDSLTWFRREVGQ
jgi:hypothetical protein